MPESRPYSELPSGFELSSLAEAVSRSGYPLQADVSRIIVDALSSVHGANWSIQEEWAFLDSDSGKTRSIDILVDSPLLTSTDRALFTPILNLVAECKQSANPHVFFLRSTPPSLRYSYPEISGLPHQYVKYFVQEGSNWQPAFQMNLHDVLKIWDLAFFKYPCPFAVSFAKAHKPRKAVELSGEEAYQSLTLPLMKAADYLKQAAKSTVAKRHRPRMILCLAVIRGPMFGAYYDGENHQLAPVPWVRLSRLEPGIDANTGTAESIVRYIDVVHESVLSVYLSSAIKASCEIGARMVAQQEILVSGRAVASLEGDAIYESQRPVPQELVDVPLDFSVPEISRIAFGADDPRPNRE